MLVRIWFSDNILTHQDKSLSVVFATRRWRVNLWQVLPFLIAVLVSVPAIVVLVHLAYPMGEVWQHLADTVLSRYVINTVWLALGVGVIGLFIGGGTAWLCANCRFPGRSLFEWALLLPLAVPTYAIAFSYSGLLEYAGPVQSSLRAVFGWSRGDYWFPEIHSLPGAILVMAFVLYPYVYLLGRAGFLGQSGSASEISRTLGRGPWRTFFAISLPLARPAMIAGIALMIMEALSDFGAVQYLGVDTFTTGIYRTWFALGAPQAAAQLSAILLLFVFAAMLMEQWSRGRARYYQVTGRDRLSRGIQLRGMSAVLAVIACFVPLALGFLVPSAQLVLWTIESWSEVIDKRFIEYAWHSVSLAALTSALALFLALALRYSLRIGGGWGSRLCIRFAGLGYAVPGSVIAVGVLLPFGFVDRTVDEFAREWFGVSTGLIFTGGIAVMVFGYLVRFLAVALGAVESAMDKISPQLDDAARTLGCGPGQRLWRLHVPLLFNGLVTGGLLVFVDVMKELPATLILRPFNFDTLAVRAFELASDELLAESACASLAIVVVGLIPVIVLSHAVGHFNHAMPRVGDAA